MEELRQYVDVVKKNIETIKAPDYEGKGRDLENQQEQLEQYERYLKAESVSSESFDRIVDAAVGYASEDISFSELEDMYNQLTK
ncbi:YnfE family protein [Priestia megaterium]|uniref:YnfE family protein n=1 Tax=Priestia megaterium TaxID=1404 RepID=UPI0021ABD6A0|nr:YnfE family protein [Priestia megaterium]MCR8928979.1 YnfE family protein [Priestia megaterium]